MKLLRCGAVVIVTTRFPNDAASRYEQEPDYSKWEKNIHLYGLDMRHLPSVLSFIEHVNKEYKCIDIIINNAAQTIRRPPLFYQHLMDNEKKIFFGNYLFFFCYFLLFFIYLLIIIFY